MVCVMKRKNTDQLLKELMDSNDLSRVLSDNSACFREGDLPQMWADTHKAETILGWKAEKTVADMCRDSWNFVCSVKKQ